MTAAATKPRVARMPKVSAPAPAAYKRLARSPYHPATDKTAAERLEILQDVLRTADQKIDAVYDVVERGTPADGLLYMISTDLMHTALYPMLRNEDEAAIPVTRADIDVCHEALFPVLAALEGVMALSVGTVISATLAEVWQMLDWANDETDSAALGALLPEAYKDAPFLRGRDLAIAMLEKGREIEGTDEAEALRWFRDGRAQNRFVLGYLHELFERPELIEGFAAVLSAKLSSSDSTDIACLAVPRAEYEAGVAGEDGTLAGEIDDAAITATPSARAAPPLPMAEAASDTVRTAIRDAMAEGANAVSVLRAAAHDATDAHFGVLALARLALDGVKAVKLDSRRDEMDQALSDASCLYAQVIAVCSAVNTDDLDDELMHAGESLLILAKYYVDAAIVALP